MSPQDFLDEILKPALDLIAEEYEIDSFSYGDGVQESSLEVTLDDQTFVLNVS